MVPPPSEVTAESECQPLHRLPFSEAALKADILPFEAVSASRDEWTRFHAYRWLRHEEKDPDDPLIDDGTTEELLKRPGKDYDLWRFVVVDAAKPASQIGWLEASVYREGSPSYPENKHILWFEMALLAPFRRQGIGTRLLAKVAELARVAGKSVLQTYTEEDDGKAFLDAVGIPIAQHRRENRLRLQDVDWRMVRAWADDGPRRSPQTRLRWFGERIDDEVIEEFSRAYTEVFNQQPFGELDIQGLVFNTETIREAEDRMVASGCEHMSVVSVEPDGEISGLTEMGYFPSEKSMIRQFMTGVREGHRGRGLGKWLKAVMLLHVREAYPQIEFVVTGNASSNEAMLSINERLGFRTHREAIMAQTKLSALEAYLRRARGRGQDR